MIGVCDVNDVKEESHLGIRELYFSELNLSTKYTQLAVIQSFFLHYFGSTL